MARPDPVRLIENETVAQALTRLRGESIGERIVYFYVTEADGKLIGVVPTRRLLLSDPSTRVGEIMVHPVVSVCDTDVLGSALETLTERRLLALPVVDSNGCLSGILDLSSLTQTLFDVERKGTVDEIFQMVGLHVEQERSKALWWVLANRAPWLLMNVCSGIVAAIISNVFASAFQAVIAVAFFIPLVLTLAESVAMQTVTMSLQSLHGARHRIAAPRWILRELRAGVLLGFLTGGLVAILDLAWLGHTKLAIVVACSVILATTAGSALGYVVPRAVHALKLDPKIASGPAVLALTDVAALSAYLGLAASFLA